MESEHENRYNAAIRTSAFLLKPEHAPIIGSIGALNQNAQMLPGLIKKVEDAMKDQLSPTEGITLDKAAIRRVLGMAAEMVGLSVASWADQAGNMEIFNKVNFTVSDFMNGRDTLAKTRAQDIFEIAKANLAACAFHGLLQSEIDTLETAIGNYDKKVQAPQQANNKRKGATTAIEVAMKNLFIIVNRCDRLVRKLRETYPEFYEGYQNARRIIDNPGATHDTTNPDPNTPPSPTPPPTP